MVDHPVRRLTCRVVGLEDATHDVRVVRLEIIAGGPFRFAAGQYASVTFDALAPRDYSMANRPDEAMLEFHVRHMQDEGASGFVASKLRLGDTVKVEGPYGEAWLRQDHAGPILAIAGGSGLAPIKSIVETALAAGMRQDIHLYFGGRDETDLYLEEHFRALARIHPNLRFVPVLSNPGTAAARRSGLLSDAIGEDFAGFERVKAYIAGPPLLVETVAEMLARRGLGRGDIHADPFWTEAEKAARGGGPYTHSRA
ncbi:MAG: FAD-binding oxidoreductase [Alphaproteobacteria bacterium]